VGYVEGSPHAKYQLNSSSNVFVVLRRVRNSRTLIIIIIISRFDTVPACDGQTNRQTDGRIHDDRIYRASIASAGKNGNRLWFCASRKRSLERMNS